MPPTSLPFPWNEFLHFQPKGDRRSVSPDSLGQEEALSALVDDIGAGRGPSDPDQIRRQFDNLRSNRTAKHRRRFRLDRRMAEDILGSRIEGTRQVRVDRGPFANDHSEAVATRELVGLVRKSVPATDWRILWMLAEGYSYSETAARCEMTIEALKCRASRARGRIRNSPVGSAILAAIG